MVLIGSYWPIAACRQGLLLTGGGPGGVVIQRFLIIGGTQRQRLHPPKKQRGHEGPFSS